MRTPPADPRDPYASPATKVVVAVGMVAVAFAALVAASYPDIVASFTLGVLSAVAVRHFAGRLASASELCVPGTDICLRFSRA